mgnify:CR=1 FL=1
MSRQVPSIETISPDIPNPFEGENLKNNFEAYKTDFRQTNRPTDYQTNRPRDLQDTLPSLFSSYKKAIDEQILLVTLNKRNHGKEHRYHDYFIDFNTFHWQSQNRSSPANSSGQKIINHETEGSNVHLFVRKHKMAGKRAAPFVYLGRVSYQKHTGAEPMNVVWKMSEPLSANLQEEFIEAA